MADAAKKVVEFIFEGFSGDTQGFSSVFINSATDPLNEDGKKVLADQQAKRTKAGHPALVATVDGKEVPVLEVRLYLPYPVGGIEQFVDPSFLTSYKAAYQKWSAAKGCDVEFSLDKWILGQMRIDVNRDTLTPRAYKLYTIAGVKQNPKNTKAKRAKADDGKSFTTAL